LAARCGERQSWSRAIRGWGCGVEERVGLLVDHEWTAREQRTLTRRLRGARLRYPASLENVDYQRPRGLTRQVLLSLATGAWIRARENVVVVGPASHATWCSPSLHRRKHRRSLVRAPSSRATNSVSLAAWWSG
jgi:hypothetical protein